jgi:hypothetical protein
MVNHFARENHAIISSIEAILVLVIEKMLGCRVFFGNRPFYSGASDGP